MFPQSCPPELSTTLPRVLAAGVGPEPRVTAATAECRLVLASLHHEHDSTLVLEKVPSEGG